MEKQKPGQRSNPKAGVPVKSKLNGQQMKSSTSGQPMRSRTSGQPMRSGTSGQPMRSGTSGQPMRSRTSGQPMRSRTSGQSMRSRTSGQSMRSNTSGQPMRSGASSQPMRNSTSGRPIRSSSGSHSKDEEIRRRKVIARRREFARRKRNKQIIQRVSIFVFLMCFVIISIILLLPSKVNSSIEIEVGTATPTVDDFLKKSYSDASLLTNLEDLDLTIPGDYPVEIQIGKKTYNSTLKMIDTIAPSGTAVNNISAVGVTLDAHVFVENIQDATAVTVSYITTPDFTAEGEQVVNLTLTDAGGNKSELAATLTLMVDKEAPVINGVSDLTVYQGDTIAYKKDIVVTDNVDKDVSLEVDSSGVDMKTVGTYSVTYIATDLSGNVATAQASITVKEDVGAENREEMEALADNILSEIITDGMTDMEKAKVIYNWCRTNIGYTKSSDKSSWTNGAIQAFTGKSGDCFIYFSAAKALLTQAGIENIDVVKSDTSHSSHYWSLVNCGDGYYHFDTTPRYGDGDYFFMVTDAQIQAYSAANNNSHIFDTSLYPATPTTIITEL